MLNSLLVGPESFFAKNSDLDNKDLNLYYILNCYLTCIVSLLYYILLFKVLFLTFKGDVVLQVLSLSCIRNMGFQYIGIPSFHVSMALK